MATRPGPRSCIIIGRLVLAALFLAASLLPARAETVDAEDYHSFFLWAGVEPQPALSQAEQVYILAGEVSDHGYPHVISQRSAIPHISGPKVWIVYRAQTLNWDEAVFNAILTHVESWRAAGNELVGLQIDFDAGTKHLEGYAAFLAKVRVHLPKQYKLSVTGLLDWSANGGSAGLQALSGVVDEVVLQIYQGRHVIEGYQRYLTRISRLNMPFRIGLLQGGEWQAPAMLEASPDFRGYVVFLLNARP